MIYFVSDIHLGLFDRKQDIKREDLFIEFLNKIKVDCDKLYLVGDIFDYWFDYNTVIPKYFYRTLSALYDLRKICEIEFVFGNHDFGHNGFFADELDIPVHGADIERQHNGKNFYISHGDGKDPKDKGYHLLKKIMRAPASLALYLKLHPNIGIKLASSSSKTSRDYTTKKDYGEDNAMLNFAKHKIDAGFDYVIMGHRHKAETTAYNNGLYVNLGEWIRNPHYGVFDGNKFVLKNFGTDNL
ncbi:MAG: UDP-2,3-diacylglucosamine diphosphatase [Candidatus Kapabacteria bacterium]|nr:UDP-2,3-diacylglucosamine diphosphatase [Candidatus Kapabacteria bacterium]